jgi:hypothetical protein
MNSTELNDTIDLLDKLSMVRPHNLGNHLRTLQSQVDHFKEIAENQVVIAGWKISRWNCGNDKTGIALSPDRPINELHQCTTHMVYKSTRDRDEKILWFFLDSILKEFEATRARSTAARRRAEARKNGASVQVAKKPVAKKGRKA